MATKFAMSRDINGYNGFGLPFSVDGAFTTLAQNVAQSFTVPSDYPNWIAVFSYSVGSNVFVNGMGTATVPGGTVTDSTSQLNPVARAVKGGQTISVITPDTAAYVQISYYVKDEYMN